MKNGLKSRLVIVDIISAQYNEKPLVEKEGVCLVHFSYRPPAPEAIMPALMPVTLT